MKNVSFRLAGMVAVALSTSVAFANIPGGGNGTGPAVTVVNNGDGTVTMANGLVSIVITTSSATLYDIYYTYNNNGVTATNQVLNGGKDGGMFYWELGGFSSGNFTYSLVTNSGSYAEVDLFADSATNGTVDIHYSMFRGSPGFYVTPIWSHRAQDGAMGTGEMRDNIYIAPYFNWMSVDAARNFEMGTNETHTVAYWSTAEDSLVVSPGPRQGTYDDKYKGITDLLSLRVWGWSSVSDATVGMVGQNIGIWHIKASSEYDAGGPLNADLTDAPMVNMIGGSHSFPLDNSYGSGEVWSRASGPYFIYFNNVTNTLSNPVQTSSALYSDAQAQAVAEVSAWPYGWFNNPVYAPAAQRGVVTGRMVIADSGNPNASASNLWVGLVCQPITVVNNYDFQAWAKPLHFWVHTDANGNFAISNVVAANNYTLYAFGPGAPGTFMSQAQTGGNPPLLFNVATNPFAVTVTAGATNNLGTVVWVPSRVGATVFEIGYPDRKADKFRHGDDYNVGDIGPSPTAPSPIWNKFLEYPFDFPNGVNYVVGQSRWSTDWNYVQSSEPDFAGNAYATSSTITFTLPSAPAANSTASLFITLAANDDDAVILTVNGQNLGSASGVSAAPSSLPTTGYGPPTGDDTSVREGNHGPVSDERVSFPGTLLVAGANTINLALRQAGGASFFNQFMYDYVRLELTGYVPPPPASVTAYAGNQAVLLCWPATPGATSYNILRSPTSGGIYASITNGVIGPVCGSGPNNATYVDASAANGTTYYYEVQSVNPTGSSASSPPSAGVTPSSGLSTTAPATPAGLTVTSTNNGVTLAWNASPGANFYTIQRGTVINRTITNQLNYVPFYITLNNTNTGTTYTDASGTLGCLYSYTVSAVSVGGTSSSGAAVIAKPVPPPPATPPGNVQLSDVITSTNQAVTVTWSPVSGAVGYMVYRAANSLAPYSFPTNFVMSQTATNWTDSILSTNTLFSYLVVAMNAGGVSSNSVVVSTPPASPASLNAYPGNAQVTLIWSASVGATNYLILRGTQSGGETLLTGATNSSYADLGVTNGITYYYMVEAVGPSGTSLNSPEASATPTLAAGGTFWTNTLTSAAQSWNVSTNWINAANFPNATQVVAIVNSAIAAGQTINLNLAITVGALSLGAGGGAFTVAPNGGTLTFNNAPWPASLVELPASSGDTIAAPMNLNSDLTVSNASANVLNLSGSIAGTNGITVTGAGTVALSGANSFTGGLVVAGGNLELENQYAAGTNMIQLTGGGTLNENTISFANTIANSGTNTWTISGSGNVSPAAPLTGSGQLNLNITCSGVCTPGGDWSQFAGLIAWAPGNGAQCRLYGTLGSASAWFNLGNSTGNLYSRNGGATIQLGALSGGANTLLSGASAENFATVYALGGMNTNSTFNGRIADGAGLSAVVKTGTGTLTLAGTNTYSGTTTVSNGTLLVTGNSSACTNLWTVAAGGTLGGSGIIGGSVTFLPGSYATNYEGSPLVLTNTLNLSGNTFYVGTPNVLGAGSYPLMVYNPVGSSGVFNSTPMIGGAGLAPFYNGAVITTNGTVKLLVTLSSSVTLPTVAVTVTPTNALRNQSVLLSVTVTPGSGTVTNVSVNASALGLSSALPLTLSNVTNVWTNTIIVPAGVTAGGYTLSATATDTTPLTGSNSNALAVVASVEVWNGSGPNVDWTDGTNWVSGLAPGYVGDSVVFAGGINLSPDINQNYTVNSLTFSNNAGSFALGSAEGDVLALSNSVVNNSTNSETINLAVALANNLGVVSGIGGLTVNGGISGSYALTNVSGMLTLANATNSYTGGTMVNGGTVVCNNAPGSGTVYLNGGTLNEVTFGLNNPMVVNGTNTWIISGSGNVAPGGTLSGNGYLYLNPTCSGVFTCGGDWSQFSGTIAWAPGNGAQCRFYGTAGSANAVFNLGTNGATLYDRNGSVTINMGALIGGPATTIAGASTYDYPTSYVIGALNLNCEFDGRITDNTGTTALTKVGSGVLTLTSTNNTYSGGTTVSNGTLLVNNAAGSGAGSGALAVNASGTLAGTGIIVAPVTVNAGGALAPGNPLGLLTISNNLTLAGGSTTLMQVQPYPLTNGSVKVSGNLLLGGTLSVTNIGSAFTNGDSFQLFRAASFTGGFTNLVLPLLTGKLGWNTAGLTNAGVLSVVALSAPTIKTVKPAGANLTLTGSGGTTNWAYRVLTATNIALAATNWTSVGTNQFDGGGNFSLTLTNAFTPGSPREFYRLQLQ